jgi:uncharacterized membrane protein
MTTGPQPVLQNAHVSSRVTVLQRAQQPALALFAIGMIGLGVLALVVGDFAMVWQPVPSWIPARTALAYGSGVLMLVCGVGLLFRSTTAWSIRILLPYLVAWQMLKLPAIFVAPSVEGVYLGFGELAVLLAGGWTLFARLGQVCVPKWLNWAVGDRGVRIARYYFALWIIPIGLSHWIYLKPSMDLVPPWLPDKAFWVRLAGAGQIASGLGVLFGVLPRVAAWAEAIQISLYTLLIWLPAILLANRNLGPTFANGGMRLSFTAFLISWAVASGAWAVAQNRSRQTGQSSARLSASAAPSPSTPARAITCSVSASIFRSRQRCGFWRPAQSAAGVAR